MTTIEPDSRATRIRVLILDAAQPLADACARLYADGNAFYVKSLHISYEDDGVRTEANPALAPSAREEVYSALIDTFGAAGWGHSSHLYRPTTGRKDGFREGDRLSVTFNHPSPLSRPPADR